MQASHLISLAGNSWFEVTFPPRDARRVRQLRAVALDDGAPEFEVAAICIAAEYGFRLPGVRCAFCAWNFDVREAFGIAAVEHLKAVQRN